MDDDSFVDGDAYLVLQKRHLPDQPLEYLLKFKLKCGRKCREKWISADKLRTKLSVGTALIKQFEVSKVGQRAVDAYLSKRRSLSSTVSFRRKRNRDTGEDADARHKSNNVESADKALKCKSCNADVRHTSCNRVDSVSSESLKSNSIVNNNSSPLCASKVTVHKPLTFYGTGTQAIARQKHFAKRLLLSDKVPRRSWSKNPAKCLKLPNLMDCKLGEQKSVIVKCKYEDSDSDADVRYSLATDHSNASSDVDAKLSGCSEKKRRKLVVVNGIKKSKISTAESKQPKVSGDTDVKFKPANLSAAHTNCKAEVRLNDCSSIATHATTPSSVTRLPSVCGVVVVENGNGQQHPKPSPALPSSTADSKKTEHCHDRGDGATHFHGSSNKIKHYHVNDIKKPECCRDDVSIIQRYHDDSGSESSTPHSESARRISVRQTELAYRFKEIVIRKMRGYMHVSLVSHTRAKNAVNPNVFHELLDALHNARCDDSHVLLLTGSGNVFCSGVDLHYLLTECTDRRVAAKTMSDCLRDFVNTLITFPKPVVVAVNGAAVGFGMALLALCDVVYASDKASFCCPYTRLCQTPEACASYTLPKILGSAMANELLLCGRKITALQACQAGLLSQVFWPTNMMQEVIPRVQNLASQSAKVLEMTKALVQGRRRRCLELVNMAECQLLSERWASTECQSAMRQYVDSLNDSL